jgi:hypothetical protein
MRSGSERKTPAGRDRLRDGRRQSVRSRRARPSSRSSNRVAAIVDAIEHPPAALSRDDMPE